MSARTRMSAKGQVVVPRRLRDARGWTAGTPLELVERPDGLLLRTGPGAKADAAPVLARIQARLGDTGATLTRPEWSEAVDRMLGDRAVPRRGRSPKPRAAATGSDARAASPALPLADTDTLLRAVLDDDPRASAAAATRLGGGVFVPLTMILELGWVLSLQFGREDVADTLTDLIDTVYVADEPELRRAVADYRLGGRLADALHRVGHAAPG